MIWRIAFYEELRRVLNQFSKYHMKILLRNFDTKVGREDLLKQTVGIESLREISNDNGVGLLIMPHLKIFPHRNIHKYI